MSEGDVQLDPPSRTQGPALAGWIVPVLAILLACWLSHAGLTPAGAATTPDAIRYLEVAANLRDGRGLVGLGPDPLAGEEQFTAWGPLYPLVLSAFMDEGEERTRSAAELGLLALSISAVLVFALARIAAGTILSTLCALAFAVAQPTLTVFTYAWSESLLIPTLLLCVATAGACVRAAELGRPKRLTALVLALAVLLALAVFARYPGFLFAALLPFAWLASVDKRRWLPQYASALVVYAAATGGLAYRNWRLSGHLSGALRAPPDRSLGENVAEFVATIRLQLSTAPLALLLAALLAAALSARWLLRPAPARGGGAARGGELAAASLVASLTYSIGVVVLQSLMSIDPLDTRYVSPAFALLLLFACLRIGRRFSEPGRAPAAVLELSACAAFLCLSSFQGLATYRSATSAWFRFGSPQLPLSRDEIYVNYNRAGFSERIAAEYELYRSLASGSVEAGDVEDGLRYARACLRLDRERAEHDLLAMAAPFWERPELFDEGLRFYQELLTELPDAWWLHHNVAALASRLGLAELAAAEFRAADELRSRAEQVAPPGPAPADIGGEVEPER